MKRDNVLRLKVFVGLALVSITVGFAVIYRVLGGEDNLWVALSLFALGMGLLLGTLWREDDRR